MPRQVRELRLTVVQHLLQLRHAQQAVLVRIRCVKQLVNVLGGQGRVDGRGIAKHKDAPVAAFNTQELVCQDAPVATMVVGTNPVSR